MKAIGFTENQRNWENYRDILLVLLQKDIKVRYTNKVLGYLWSVANPLANAFIFYFAFSVIMQIRQEDYVMFLITGLFPWQWLSNSVNSSPRMFIGSASLIKKLNFPRIIIPLAVILNHMVHFVLSMPVILLFLLLHHRLPSFTWLYGIPLLMAIQLLLCLGASLLFASLNLFLRDLERLVALMMSFVFYFTPILYGEEMIPDRFKDYLLLNPAGPLITSWRQLFVQGTLNTTYILISLGYGIIWFALGYFVYRKLCSRFVEAL